MEWLQFSIKNYIISFNIFWNSVVITFIMLQVIHIVYTFRIFFTLFLYINQFHLFSIAWNSVLGYSSCKVYSYDFCENPGSVWWCMLRCRLKDRFTWSNEGTSFLIGHVGSLFFFFLWDTIGKILSWHQKRNSFQKVSFLLFPSKIALLFSLPIRLRWEKWHSTISTTHWKFKSLKCASFSFMGCC